MKEIQIKPDAAGKNANVLTVNGKQMRFNPSAVNDLGLKEAIHLSLASTSDDENARPDRLLIRASHPTVAKRTLTGAKGKWRDLNSEEVLKATRMPNGSYPIEYDAENQVHYVTLESDWQERTTFEKNPRKARDANKAIAADIKAKRDAGNAAKATGSKAGAKAN